MKAALIRLVESDRPQYGFTRKFSVSKQTVSDYVTNNVKKARCGRALGHRHPVGNLERGVVGHDPELLSPRKNCL